MSYKIYLLLLSLSTICFSKQETVKIYEGMFKDNVYQGNIENGKLNGKGILYCEDKPNKIFLNGTFIDNEFTNGKLDSCKDFSARDEIKFGNIVETKYSKEYKPFYEYTIDGYFKSDKKNLSSLFNENMDITVNFYNTQSYDKIIGKTRTLKDKSATIDGTLYLLNNKIKEIKTNWIISNLEFGGGEIYIKGYDFILEGYTKNDDDINNFTFDGVVKWNNNTEYYLTNMKFKKDLIEKIENFKKLATPIKDSNISNKGLNTVNGLKNEVSINNGGRNLNINTNNIEYTNNKVYKQNDNEIIDLEKR